MLLIIGILCLLWGWVRWKDGKIERHVYRRLMWIGSLLIITSVTVTAVVVVGVFLHFGGGNGGVFVHTLF